MSFDPRQRRAALHAFLTAHSLRPYPLALASGVSEGTLRGFLAARVDTLTDKTYEKLAGGASKVLGRDVTTAELRGDNAAPTKMAVGYAVERDSHLVMAGHGHAFAHITPPPEVLGGGAALMRDDTGMPTFERGDILVWAPPQLDVKAFVGKASVVKIKGGPLMLSRLMRGSAKGKFHLLSMNPSVAALEDQQVEWAAPISWIKRAA